MLSRVETGSRPRMNPEMFAALGKKIVIIGDVEGIGRMTAAMLVEQGAKVFIAVSTPAELTAAFAEIAQTGGEWDGMAVDLSAPGEIRWFFDQAERRLGRIDALVSLLAADPIFAMRNGSDAVLRTCLQEALVRMRHRRGSQVISIGATGRGIPADLRREAGEWGIRMTLIDPGSLSQPGPALERQELAGCILSSLAQSYVPDVVFMRGQRQAQPI